MTIAWLPHEKFRVWIYTMQMRFKSKSCCGKKNLPWRSLLWHLQILHKLYFYIFMFTPCINSIKTLLLFQLMHTIIRNHRMLKQF